MDNRVVRLMENCKRIYGEEEYAKQVERLGGFKEDMTPKEQAAFINAFIRENKAQDDGKQVVETLRACGHECLSNRTISLGKKLYKESKTMKEFLEALNDRCIGGGYLHLEGEGKIIGLYKDCYCTIPKQIRKMDPTYCECSAGWYEHFFSQVLETKVNVTKLGTILNGAHRCTFEITYDNADLEK
ncbi:MAG: hypothetical protein E7256_00345 [Lachnospiraceae bacterium]|nr:hypothetical protein [Lachnospiraceae bacterium]